MFAELLFYTMTVKDILYFILIHGNVLVFFFKEMLFIPGFM